MQDTAYRDFHRRLVPNLPADTIIGVRMPQLRRMARDLECHALFASLPHSFYEENQLHAILVSGMKDFGRCIVEVERFLPYVDNWATCDALRPHCFRGQREAVLDMVPGWLASGHEYTVRFGIGMLEAYFLDDCFRPEHLRWVADLRREEYYIRMMQAWYFATALAKQWEKALPVLPELPAWVRGKTIQKACESFRVSQAHKEVLRALR